MNAVGESYIRLKRADVMSGLYRIDVRGMSALRGSMPMYLRVRHLHLDLLAAWQLHEPVMHEPVMHEQRYIDVGAAMHKTWILLCIPSCVFPVSQFEA
jgi:hypothetical protein